MPYHILCGRAAAPFVLALLMPVAAAASEPEAAFLAETTAAMTRMMADMDTKPTGNVGRDFVAMMRPHHQGAIDMAQAVLRYGRNEQLRRIAQEIIIEQQQEIAAMQVALGEPPPPSAPSPTEASTARPAPAAVVHRPMPRPRS